MTTMHKIMRCSLWLMGWLGTFGAYAQGNSTLLDDLAYALEDTTNRREVLAAMEQFHAKTEVGLAVAAVFENGLYAPGARQHVTEWLPQQTHGITIFITLAERTKAFRQCELHVSPSVEAWLPPEDRKQIQTGLLEFYFRSSPIPTNAYTSGLRAGIAAMEKKILESKANEKEKLPDDVVTITHVDEDFAAGIDNDKLKIEYAIKKEYVGTLKAAKLEVYKDLAKEPCFITSLDTKEENTYLWDGKLSEKDGDYITYKDSPFAVKITVSEDEEFEKVGMAEEKASVEEFADEWRSYPEIAKRVAVNRSDKDGKKLTQYQYYLMMRNDIITKVVGKDFYFLDDYNGNPLNYLSKHIVDAKFLNKEVKVHTNYLVVLQEIEEAMGKPDNDYKKYSENEDYSLAGIFYIRYLNNRNAMSNHSFGMAVDIDPYYNPQRSVPTWMFVHMMTNRNLLFAKLSPNEMQKVNNRYKSANVDHQRISEVLSGLEKIDVFNDNHPYSIDKIDKLSEAVHNFAVKYEDLCKEIKQARLRLTVLEEGSDQKEKIARRLNTEIPAEINQQKQWLVPIKQNTDDLTEIIDEGLDKMFEVKEKFPSEYEYMKNYLGDLRNRISCLEVSFDEIFVQELSNSSLSTCQLPHPTLDTKMITGTLSMVELIYKHNKMGFGSKSTYKKDRFNLFSEWLGNNKNDLIALSKNGFFRLDPSFVQYFIDHKKVRWGGHYNTDIDCMHFELYPNEF